MTGKDDVVVGCMTGYDFEAIKPWVNSLDRCGFEGSKVMLCYNTKKEVVEELTQRGYSVLAFAQDEHGNLTYKNGQPFSIVVERFFHLWAMLSKAKGQHRYLLHTDVKDVVFQRNPSEDMEALMGFLGGPKIIGASESLRYEDEDWGRQNMIDSFGQVIYDAIKDNEIINAGTLCGEFDTIIEFFLNVYMVSVGGKTHNPDQAAVNVLFNTQPALSIVCLAQPCDAWACQAGTTNDPRKPHYKEKLIRGVDGQSYCKDGIVYNFEDKPFALVHQYDRVPEWKQQILERYA